MNPREITDISVLQELLVKLLNSQEELEAGLLSTQEQLSEALDEIKRLKGEKGRPNFGPSRKRGKIKKLTKRPERSSPSDSPPDSPASPPEVDRVELVDTPPSDLPKDAIFKGYRSVYQKEIRIERDNVAYRIARWYSPSMGRYYESGLPADYQAQVGSMLRSFVQILHHCGDMTHRKIGELLEYLGVSLSSGGISNLLTQSDWVLEEQAALLTSSIAASPYTQMDSTMSKQKGQRMYTQVICGEHFSLFYTQQGKSRLDVYAALQGQSREEVKLAYTALAQDRLIEAKVSKKHLAYFEKNFSPDQVLSPQELEQCFDSEAIFHKTNQARRSVIAGALAAGYYYQQEQVPILTHLMSDDAPEYKHIASEKHIHCWVHAIRPYRLLNPKNKYFRQIHADFMDRLWEFYALIKAYLELSAPEQRLKKKEIRTQFDQLFETPTDYRKLNEQMERTKQNQAYLLAFVDYPLFPLHNNAAERGARRIVRKRDISFHTWSQRGTAIRDAFISLHQTAKKLKISFLDYLYDRNARRFQLPNLAQLVQQAYQQ